MTKPSNVVTTNTALSLGLVIALLTAFVVVGEWRKGIAINEKSILANSRRLDSLEPDVRYVRDAMLRLEGFWGTKTPTELAAIRERLNED